PATTPAAPTPAAIAALTVGGVATGPDSLVALVFGVDSLARSGFRSRFGRLLLRPRRTIATVIAIASATAAPPPASAALAAFVGAGFAAFTGLRDLFLFVLDRVIGLVG